MPYPQDLVGKYVNYKVDDGVTLAASMTLVNGVLPGRTTSASARVYTKGAAANAYDAVAVPWSFTFLQYVAGAVTTTPLTTAAMTGPMSGCYLFEYKQDNLLNLAHVGTANAADSDATKAVKAAWKTFVRRPEIQGIAGASPAESFSLSEIRSAMVAPGQIPKVVGYFASAVAYAMLLAPAGSTPQGPLMKVSAVKKMTLRPWAAIATLPKFSD